jgi:hypothetical protein
MGTISTGTITTKHASDILGYRGRPKTTRGSSLWIAALASRRGFAPFV